MEITLPISSIIIIAIGSVGVVISLLCAIFLFYNKKGQYISIVFLSVFMLLSGLTLFNDVLNISGLKNEFKNLYFIPIFYSLSIAPLFYLFVKSKYYQKVSKSDYLHLLIPLLQALLYWSIGFQSIEFKSSLWANASFRMLLTVESFLFPASLIIYSYLSNDLLRNSSKTGHFWEIDLKTWLSRLTRVFIFIALLELTISVLEYVFTQRLGTTFLVLRFVFFLVFILWVVYNAIKLLYPTTIYTSMPKVAPALLATDDIDKIQSTIMLLMEEDQIYLNPDLTLQLLASYAGTTEKKCSYVLNKGLKTNFNQFINGYRIASFKQKVKNGEHSKFTLLSLAYASGFESKSTFNRAFKNLTGMTPSQFVKSI